MRGIINVMMPYVYRQLMRRNKTCLYEIRNCRNIHSNVDNIESDDSRSANILNENETITTIEMVFFDKVHHEE